MQTVLIPTTVAILSVSVWPHSLTIPSMVIDGQVMKVLKKVSPQGPPSCCMDL
jgi:hypothetical protein